MFKVHYSYGKEDREVVVFMVKSWYSYTVALMQFVNFSYFEFLISFSIYSRIHISLSKLLKLCDNKITIIFLRVEKSL